MLVSISGTCDGQELIEGEVVELGEASALDFLARGMAEHLEKVRSAEKTASRNAAKPRGARG
jgi:hypothetical protein